MSQSEQLQNFALCVKSISFIVFWLTCLLTLVAHSSCVECCANKSSTLHPLHSTHDFEEFCHIHFCSSSWPTSSLRTMQLFCTCGCTCPFSLFLSKSSVAFVGVKKWGSWWVPVFCSVSLLGFSHWVCLWMHVRANCDTVIKNFITWGCVPEPTEQFQAHSYIASQ